MPMTGRRRRRRRNSTDATAITELGDAFTALHRRHRGKHALFERLTGPEQLWWRCCADAVRSRSAWLYGDQAEQCMALISGEDLARGDRTVTSAAAATLRMSRALAITDEEVALDLARQAAGSWRSAGAPAPVSAGLPLPRERALASVYPGLRGRVERLLAVLDRSDREPGNALATISVLMLAGAQPAGRTVRMPIALTATYAGQVIGVAGTLRLCAFPGGPAGLFPDPSAAQATPRYDRDFAHALNLAWALAAGNQSGARCALWRLELDPTLEAWTVDGSSLGAAIFVAVHELLWRGPVSVPRVLTVPAGLFTGLRSRRATTGVLAGDSSGADGPANRKARRIRLGAVQGLVVKGLAAQSNGWQLVAPQTNQEPDQNHVPEAVRVSWVRTIHGADKRARHIRWGRIALLTVVVLGLAGFATERISAGAPTSAGGPPGLVFESNPPTAGLLTGPQLQALLVPISRFPASYIYENEQVANSGSTLEYVPYLLGCQDFEQLIELGSQGLGSAANASATFPNTKGTHEFNQGIFEFWNTGQAKAFFTNTRALLSSCFADAAAQEIYSTVHSATITGLPAFTDTIKTDIGIDTTLFAVQGLNVYFAGAYSPNSHVLPTAPSLSSLVIQLVANVHAHPAG
jgi:hypothetical protein